MFWTLTEISLIKMSDNFLIADKNAKLVILILDKSFLRSTYYTSKRMLWFVFIGLITLSAV